LQFLSFCLFLTFTYPDITGKLRLNPRIILFLRRRLLRLSKILTASKNLFTKAFSHYSLPNLKVLKKPHRLGYILLEL